METFYQLREKLSECTDEKLASSLAHSSFLIEDEVLQALTVLKGGLSNQALNLKPFKSGAVPLFTRSLFPWGGLPYPEEHALLGTLLMELKNPEFQEIARGMVPFQYATVDHNGVPLASLFVQERRFDRAILSSKSAAFLSHFPAQPKEFLFVDRELGVIVLKEPNATVACLASGCKSGMLSFLHRDVGVLNFGPQLSPVENCEGFGLAGRGQNIVLEVSEKNFSLSSYCRLAAPNPRKACLERIEDSGYSGLWVETEARGNPHSLELVSKFKGTASTEGATYSLFGRGAKCLISGSHQLKPRSLDRYRGPIQPLAFISEEASVQVVVTGGAVQMEVIPLAHDTSFWGADFLVSFKLAQSNIHLHATSESVNCKVNNLL